MKRKKLSLKSISVKSFVPLTERSVYGGGSLFSCATPQGCGDTVESCLAEKCMAGDTEAGTPGCPGTS